MPTPRDRTPRPDEPNPGHSMQDIAGDLQGQAGQIAEEAKRQGKEQLENYRQSAADELEKIAEGARAAATELEEQDESALSSYVLDTAESLYQLADKLRGKSVEELIQQAGRLARENPALFVTGSVALGFGLMRFARASGRRVGQQPERERQPGAELQAMGGEPMATGANIPPHVTVTATPDGTVTASSSRMPGRGTHRLPPGDIGHGLTGAAAGTPTGAAAGTPTGSPEETPRVSPNPSDRQGPSGGMQ